MGSWNETCWLSNLPITAGSSFYLVLLKENHGYGSDRTRGFVYNHAVWAPFALPIPGTYNDYGELEGWDTTDPALEVLRLYLRENVITYPVGENTVHDLPVTREMFDQPDWVEQIQQRMSHGMGIQVDEYKKPRLGAVFIRGDVYDALAERATEDWRTGGEINLQSKVEEIAEYVKCQAAFKAAQHAYYSARRSEVGEEKMEALLMAHIETQEKVRGMWMMPREWCPDWVLNDQMALEDEGVRRRMAAFLQVADAASGLRKLWHPTCGSGSQSGDWDLYMDFFKITYEGAKTSSRRFLDEDSDSEWKQKFYGAFWDRFPPTKILEYNGRCQTVDIKDINGDPVPGVGDFGAPGSFTASAWNYTCLFIVEDSREQVYWYVLYNDESDEWLELKHPVAPHHELVRYMNELTPPEGIDA